MFGMLVVFVKFEKDIIQQRMLAGFEAARRQKDRWTTEK